MIRYEILMLARPDMTSDEIANLEAAIDKNIVDAKGKVITFDRWGKYRLAYPVEKNAYGQYMLSRFEVTQDSKGALLKDLDTLLKIKWNEQIVRFVTKLLDPDAPLTYAKPEPVDSSESRERDKALSKIETSLKGSAPVASDKPVAKEAPAPKPAEAKVAQEPAEPQSEASAASDDEPAEA